VARVLWIVAVGAILAIWAFNILDVRSPTVVLAFFFAWGLQHLAFGVYRLMNPRWRESEWWRSRQALAFMLGGGRTHFGAGRNRFVERYSAATQALAGVGLIVLPAVALW
jgi:hypothetical protein